MQYQQELKDLQHKSHKLLVDINEEDNMRDGFRVRRKQRLLEMELAQTIKRQKELLAKIKEYEEYHDILKKHIVVVITNYLTIDRFDMNVRLFTDDDIDKFINKNNDKIESTIENIIDDYDKNGKTELLKQPLTDSLEKYLYQIVKTMQIPELDTDN